MPEWLVIREWSGFGSRDAHLEHEVDPEGEVLRVDEGNLQSTKEHQRDAAVQDDQIQSHAFSYRGIGEEKRWRNGRARVRGEDAVGITLAELFLMSARHSKSLAVVPITSAIPNSSARLAMILVPVMDCIVSHGPPVRAFTAGEMEVKFGAAYRRGRRSR